MKNAVFITGACRGTGYRIAEVFAQNGWSVIVTGRNGKDAYEAAEKLGNTYGVFAKGYECNIRNEQQVIDIFNDIDKSGVFVQTVVLCAADLGFGTDLSKNVTGSELIVDGGMASRLYPDYLNELIRKEQ